MKTIIAALIVAAAMLVPTATATEDLGQPSALLAACGEVSQIAISQNVVVKSCRQDGPPALSADGYTIAVPLALYTNVGGRQALHVSAFLYKSLWALDALQVNK